SCGYNDGRIAIDPSVVRGLEYYTGPVYEIDLKLEIWDSERPGQLIRFGSVGGGGRYDGLVGRFRNESVPATGFSIGVSRLRSALKALAGPDAEEEKISGPVVVTVFPDVPLTKYQEWVAKLRATEYAPGKKIRAELYLGNERFGAQVKYADRRAS